MATFTISGVAASHASIEVTCADAAIVIGGSYVIQWMSRQNTSVVSQNSAPTIATGTLTGLLHFTGTIPDFRPAVLSDGVIYVWDVSDPTKNVLLGYTGCSVLAGNPTPDGGVVLTPGEVAASTAAVVALVAAHSALATGVHGVGAGTVAKTADITKAAVGLSNVVNALQVQADVLHANSILYAVADHTPAQLLLAASKFPARASTGNILDKDISDLALTLVARATAALMRGDIGAYRIAATTAVGNVSGSVTADFAASLTNTYTLTGNCTALPLPTNLADGETGVALFTLAGFSMPTGPASTAYKGNWTVTGTMVRVIWERIGALYFCTADSLTVVA